MRATVIAGVVALVAVTLPGGRASAHAVLQEVTPANGATVDAPPGEVVLRFSEPVSLAGGSVRVLDDDAVDVATASSVANETVTVTLPADLADGTYTVTYQVISADSHPVSGASVFHVGVATSTGLTGDALGGMTTDPAWGVRAGGVVLTAIGYGGALVAVGAVLFAMFVNRAAAVDGLVARAAVLGAVALWAAAPLRIARIGGGLDALRDDELLSASLRGPIGVSTAVTAVALMILAVLADRGVARWATALFGTGALVGFALEGHTRSNSPRWAMVGSDTIHLLAGAVWFGGIVALALAFRSELDTGHLASVVRRFSSSALAAVAVVAFTGVVMAWIILPTVGELTNTGYGLALVTKVSLVVIVVGLGAFNRFRLVPAVEQRIEAAGGQRSARRWLGRVVVAELAVLLTVVGVTAVMVTRSPLPSATAAPPAADSRQNLTVPLSGNGGVVEVAVAPAKAGFNTIDLVLRDLEGRIVNPVEPPVVELSQHEAHIGPLRPDVLPLAIGRYQANTNLAIAGEWELSVRVRISDFESVSGSVTVTLGQD